MPTRLMKGRHGGITGMYQHASQSICRESSLKLTTEKTQECKVKHIAAITITMHRQKRNTAQ